MAIKINPDALSDVEPGLTPRAFARALGFDVADRGALKPDVQNVIKAAKDAGYVFAESKAVVAAKTAAPKLVEQSEIDLLAFREWQVANKRPVHVKGRISQAELNAYVTAVPDYKRREATPTSRAFKNSASHDRKVNIPGDSTEQAGSAANYYGPTPSRVNQANAYEAYEFEYDDEGNVIIGDRVNDLKGHALVKKSFKDCDTRTGVSIGYVEGYSFTFDPRDQDNELVLLPVL